MRKKWDAAGRRQATGWRAGMIRADSWATSQEAFPRIPRMNSGCCILPGSVPSLYSVNPWLNSDPSTTDCTECTESIQRRSEALSRIFHRENKLARPGNRSLALTATGVDGGAGALTKPAEAGRPNACSTSITAPHPWFRLRRVGGWGEDEQGKMKGGNRRTQPVR